MKKTIAIVAGGDSSEWAVSLRSAAGLNSFIDSEKYTKYIVTIVGKTWQVELADDRKIPIDKNDFSFMFDGKKILFDFAYITIHGTPGENGILQGYFRLLGIPFSCCDVLAAALTFDKFPCNQYLKSFGINVANAIWLHRADKIDVSRIVATIGLPCFIKPCDGGSSFGVTKVKETNQILPAIEKAFAEGSEVMIEALMVGTEVTCGMYRTKTKEVVFPITEVVTNNEFFDYDAKYNGQVQEITPARIPATWVTEVQTVTRKIYTALNAKGIIRVDYIIEKSGKVNLLEVNTTPGMTATSFIPQQVRAAGLQMKDVMNDIIENEIGQ
ncbi:MAG: D-alanine--D-alanine ligase [Sphingobacteriia bacterium]|jgi:D-alanine-D-alanine ligase|nr:D-alanine--D-alanine ligase [Sphingobacteriia bacterium]